MLLWFNQLEIVHLYIHSQQSRHFTNQNNKGVEAIEKAKGKNKNNEGKGGGHHNKNQQNNSTVTSGGAVAGNLQQPNGMSIV